MKAKKVVKPNRLFPGLPNYTGPESGWFAWVHHGKLFEHTKADGDNIKYRVTYVRRNKPKDERAIRLSHIMYLGPSLNHKLDAMRSAAPNTYGYAGMHRNDDAVKLVMAYIARHKPKNKWNVSCETLMKANKEFMTG